MRLLKRSAVTPSRSGTITEAYNPGVEFKHPAVRFRVFQTSPVNGSDLGSSVLTHASSFILLVTVLALDLNTSFGKSDELPQSDGPRHQALGQIGGTSRRTKDIASSVTPCIQQWIMVGAPFFQFSPNSRELLFSNWQEPLGTTISVSPISSPTNRTPLAHFVLEYSVAFHWT